MDYDNELLKCVMEGMGVQPSDNKDENWNTIMNFVPSFGGVNSGGNNSEFPVSFGTGIKLYFSSSKGGEPLELEFHENTPIKDVFQKYGLYAKLTEEELKKLQFLCSGRNFNINSTGTIKSNNFVNNSKIIACIL